jgi:hypothetical protein
MAKMKQSKVKTNKQNHTSNSKTGMGDYYGVGIKQKEGTIRDMYLPNINPFSSEKMGKPPKSLA